VSPLLAVTGTGDSIFFLDPAHSHQLVRTTPW
jgi:hypothetical protein